MMKSTVSCCELLGWQMPGMLVLPLPL